MLMEMHELEVYKDQDSKKACGCCNSLDDLDVSLQQRTLMIH